MQFTVNGNMHLYGTREECISTMKDYVKRIQENYNFTMDEAPDYTDDEPRASFSGDLDGENLSVCYCVEYKKITGGWGDESFSK